MDILDRKKSAAEVGRKVFWKGVEFVVRSKGVWMDDYKGV